MTSMQQVCDAEQYARLLERIARDAARTAREARKVADAAAAATKPTKKCSVCKLSKPRSLFYPDPRVSDGLRAQCKRCKNQRLKEARENAKKWAAK